jgi:phage repressor protein C with HTH and peptisase S24 domain
MSEPLTEPMAQNRIRELREAKRLSLEALGALAGTTKQQIYKLERGDVKLTVDWMNRLAPHLGVDAHELMLTAIKEQLTKPAPASPSVTRPLGATPLTNVTRDLPVLGRAAGAREGIIMIPVEQDAVDWTLRPPQLDGVPGAFAILQYGDSMDPKYCNGDTLWIHPNVPCRVGNGVLIIKNNDEALVKILVRRTDLAVTVRELSPKVAEFTIPRSDIRQIYKVIGCLSN